MTAQCQLSATSQRQALLISPQSSARKAESRKSFDPELKTEGLMSESSKKGFTLIELMVTISIIAILAAVGVVVYSSTQKSGRISKRVQDLKAIQAALELYKSATGGYPASATFQCISTPLAVLLPNYMPVLPSDPLDNGNVAGANCYEYTTGDAAVTNEYKIRTKTNLYTVSEMSSANFAQQPTMVDPARDGEAVLNCNIVPSPGPISGWALYSGSAVCDD